MARRIVRPPKSKFRVGQRVRVEADYTGDYFGVVTQTHPRLTKPASSRDDTSLTKPGITVRCDYWEGPVDYLMEIDAWDDEAQVHTSPLPEW
jgi:hypothetical protein